jgi:ABC-2 type transport system permease protein
MSRAIRVEWWKLRRSRVVATATGLMGLLLPLMGLGFYSVALSGGTGPLAGKAGALLIGEGWEAYMGLVDQIAAVAIFLGAGVVVTWVFGREHADRTFPSLFALPVSRQRIAAAKVAVLAGWMIALSLLVTTVAVVVGLMAGIGPSPAEVVVPAALRLLMIAVLASVLSSPVAVVASIGRGYMPAFGFLILVVAMAQVAVLFGTGAWFPFAVPGLMAVTGSEGAPVVGPAQVALVPMVATAAVWLTLRWWRRAEVT